jgi:hypothetical protein
MTVITATPARQGRVALLIVGLVAALWALGSAVFAIVQAITEAASGTISLQLTDARGYSSFGIPLSGGMVATGTSAVSNVSVPGLDPAPIIVHTAALIVIALAHLVLAAAAYLLARGILRDAPFSRLISRQLFAAAAALVAIAVVGQLLLWWASLLAISRFSTLSKLSPEPAINPLVITIALALVLVAGTFRYGERLQRDTEGLI